MMGHEQPHPTHNTGRRPRAWVIWLAAVAATALATGTFRRVRVSGDSMRPSFQPGDRLLIGPRLRIRPGAVVAIADPRVPDRLLVKRVHALEGESIDVRGDNEGASTDSRQLGPIPRSHLAGRVIYRYGPPGRTGWLPGSAPSLRGYHRSACHRAG
jgi:nickel-type superoxide dismutase maturation protease